MKIIKQGKKPSDRKWRGECHSCKSVMECQQLELQIAYDMRDGLAYGRANCPVCTSEVIFYTVKE